MVVTVNVNVDVNPAPPADCRNCECLDGRCVPQGQGCDGPCDVDSNCRPGCSCVRGRCIRSPPPGCVGPCQIDNDCRPDCVCRNGRCTNPIPGECTGPCQTSMDCLPGCTCRMGRCVSMGPTPPPGPQPPMPPPQSPAPAPSPSTRDSGVQGLQVLRGDGQNAAGTFQSNWWSGFQIVNQWSQDVWVWVGVIGGTGHWIYLPRNYYLPVQTNNRQWLYVSLASIYTHAQLSSRYLQTTPSNTSYYVPNLR